MTKLAWGTSFRKAFKRYTRRSQAGQRLVFETLDPLADDPFHPTLKTHTLRGELQGLWACSVGYDCRTVLTSNLIRAQGKR